MINGEKTMKALFTVLVTILISVSAKAGFMAEPWVGYESGTIQCTTVAGSDCGAKSTGANYGARLGWMLPVGFWFAGEYMGGSGTIKYDDGSADENFERTVLAASLGFDFNSGFRVFAGYGFNSNLKDKTSTGDLTIKGTATRLGLGYKFKNGLSLNAEYHMDTVSKVDVLTLTDIDSSTIWSKFNPSRALLTVGYVFGSGK